MLTDKKFISNFNGKDFKSKKILVPNFFTREFINDPSNFSNNKPKLLKETDDMISFYRDTICDIEKGIGVYKCCKIKDVLDKLTFKHTLESCKQSASKFSTKVEWEKADRNSIVSARHNGWFDECSVHMKELKNKRTLDFCKQSASKFNTKKEWEKAERSIYAYACRKKWLFECCKNMRQVYIKHTLESCK